MSRHIQVDKTGPFFSAAAADVPREFLEDFENAYAAEGVKRVKATLGSRLRHPTGRYQRGIHTTRVADSTVVTDNRAVYGPWLEGTGSRNKTTRFKGYRSFRLTAQQLDKDAANYADNLFASRYLGRLQ
jgi:spermidine synthase